RYWLAKRDWEKCIDIGEPAVEPLVAALKDKDEDVSRSVAEVLGQIGDPHAVELLINILKD
ncbi:MAG: HEAT repeat domain-containing protein, partial [Anaerolineales bacterium]|nr:HEAT repeat domain-containing protein [Anaerolineales bacterium]